MLAGRVDDVAADDGEVDAVGLGQQRRHDRVLRGVALAGVAGDEQRDRVRVRGAQAEDEVGGRAAPGRALAGQLDPPRAHRVDGVAEVPGDDVVARAPEGRRPQPRERLASPPARPRFQRPGPAHASQPAPAAETRDEGAVAVSVLTSALGRSYRRRGATRRRPARRSSLHTEHGEACAIDARARVGHRVAMNSRTRLLDQLVVRPGEPAGIATRIPAGPVARTWRTSPGTS